MTNHELCEALREYVQIEKRLEILKNHKKELEKKIRYYTDPRETPKPERPSIIATFLIDFAVCIFIIYVLCLEIHSIPNQVVFCSPIISVVLCCIITPIHFKHRDRQALSRYLTSSMKYQEWEKGKQEQLPKFQKQLSEVIAVEKYNYKKYQSAKIKTVLHNDYLPYAEIILGYFERGRVRDLTEAVNLLERELLEYRRDRETAAYREEMRQQTMAQTEAAERSAIAAERGASAAEEAAFWGAAATYVAAKNSKQNNDNYRIV